MTTTTNTAYEYALIIRNELLALETLLENKADIDADLERVRDGDTPEMDPDTLAECVAAQEELGIDEWNDDTDLISYYLNNLCLELTVLRASDDDYRDTRTRVEILRTCGGPRCDITRDNNDGDAVEIRVYDGSDTSTIRVYVSNIANELDMISECY